MAAVQESSVMAENPHFLERPPFFSLILATVGRVEHLPRLFDSLRRQTEQDFELIVVDQNADDRVVQALQSAQGVGRSILHLRQPIPNLSRARNLGLSRAQGRLAGFPDDDCRFAPTCLENVRAAWVGDPQPVGVVAKWVESPNAVETDRPLELGPMRQFRGGDASSIALFLEPRAVVAQGGFDERLGVGQWFGAGEETDVVIRLLAAGGRIVRASSAHVHHAAPAQAPRLSRVAFAALRARERGTGAIYVRHSLPVGVVLRGLAAPFVRAFLTPHRAAGFGFALAKVLGRIEGAVAWGHRTAGSDAPAVRRKA